MSFLLNVTSRLLGDFGEVTELSDLILSFSPQSSITNSKCWSSVSSSSTGGSSTSCLMKINRISILLRLSIYKKFKPHKVNSAF